MNDVTTAWEWSGPPSLRIELLRDESISREQVAIVAQEGIPGVVVVAQWDDDSILLVRQRRVAVGQHLWELPRGFGEVGDAPGRASQGRGHSAQGSVSLTSAAREVAEETGHELVQTEVVGSFYPDSGLLAGIVVVVAGRVFGPQTTQPDGEIGEYRWVTRTELDRLVATNELRDGISLAAYAVWANGRSLA